jgi:hypothetical protein
MGTMGTRQKIVLGIMTVAILYFAVDFLTPARKSQAIDLKQEQEELNTFVTTMTATLGKDAPKNLGALIFSRAEREWTQDPFLDQKSYQSWIQAKTAAQEKKVKDAVVAPKIDFTYTGYLEAGGKRMAIVNGSEYREGEALDIKGYVLTSVSPANVVIMNRATKAEQKVSLQE